MSKKDMKERQIEMKKQYIDFIMSDNKNEEFEIRFGTRGVRRISKIDFNNVISFILSRNFVLTNESEILKIQNEYFNQRTQRTQISNIRTEINYMSNIQKYCKTNSILDENNNLLKNTRFLQKRRKIDNERNIEILPVNMNEFNFRASYQEENLYHKNSDIIQRMISQWGDTKKIFRYLLRYSYENKEFPGVRIDLSIVRSSRRNVKGNLIPDLNIHDSKVLTNDEEYEIEIEIEKDKVLESILSQTSEDMSDDELDALYDKSYNNLRQVIKYILSGHQGSNYPISYKEMIDIGNDYLSLLGIEKRRLYPRDFIGPSSISLELKNILPLRKDGTDNLANIRQPYTVTEKADGLRKLLYISKKGKVYLIDTNMNVQFTGSILKNKEYFNSLLDGEHIEHDKTGRYINLYASFDIYFINGVDHRSKHFVHIPKESDVKVSENYRYYLLRNFINSISLNKVSSTGTPFRLEYKIFQVSYGGDRTTIFNKCSHILKNIEEDKYEYETDGLIFTPINHGVGVDYKNKKPSNHKTTWQLSFKWKPPEFNTIDFLVTTKKDERSNDIVSHLYQNGENMTGNNNIQQYKTLILRVGFDERIHGYINPCQDIIDDNVEVIGDRDNTKNYRPMPFYPTNPFSNTAHLCNLLLKSTATGNVMMTEDDKEVIEDNMIVEFKYVKTERDMWKWKPIRVRYDKTAEFRRGEKNYGNAYHVAQSVWSSIHQPVTEDMLRSGRGIPEFIGDDDVYYNKKDYTVTRPLRDFHNLYVKRKLIMGVSKMGDSLYDLTVGKGGDFPKWIQSKLKFVFGVDLSKDNILNRLDGACARYLNYRKTVKVMPSVLFVQGNSSLNIKNGEALYNERDKKIVDAVFGKGEANESKLGRGVFKNFGIGKDGFHITTSMFSLHYFFENKNTLHNYIRNVCEGTKLNGYFIGCAYDGKKIFDELKNIKMNESVSEIVRMNPIEETNITISNDEHKIWEITKKYDSNVFNDNITSLGYAIDVYQESINKVIREYLINFDYFTELMNSYGFQLVDLDEANRMGLPNATGLFSELYSKMKQEIQENDRQKRKNYLKNDVKNALLLDDYSSQRRISFLNRYFVYKKVLDVNVEDVFKSFVNGVASPFEEQYTRENDNVRKESRETKKVKKIKKIKKLKKKLKLKEAT